MTKLYEKYFQKSSAFLYPLLKINKTKYITPLQTYILWDNLVDIEECKLLCLYKRDYSSAMKHLENKILMPHTLLETTLELSTNRVLYVFNFKMGIYKESFTKFVEGKYSEFPKEAKEMIKNYFGVHTPEWTYIESYINPVKYHSIYAELLGKDIKELQEKVELCDKYDSEKENCPLSINEVLN